MGQDLTKKSALRRFVSMREFSVLCMVVAVFVVVTIFQPRFATWENIKNILMYLPMLLVVAMGQMMTIITRNFDLSVGSTLAFAGVYTGMVWKYWNPDFNIALAFAMAAAIGAVLGLINGVLITKLKIPAIIVTLATMNAYRGLIFILSGGHQIDPQDVPTAMTDLSNNSPIAVPWTVIFAAIICVICWFFLKYTHRGREVYAVGGNPEAAKLRGINVTAVLIIVFTICGACAGFAGAVYSSRYGMLNPNNTGLSMELNAIAAVVIGSVSPKGGSGSVFGVVLGSLLLAILSQAIAVVGVAGTWQKALYGIVIIAALVMDKVIRDRQQKSLVRGKKA